ncbi:MAG: Flp pilus assembly complex ATPase component TadA, partial [Firmicutes bacterium]|nr:Flp pilus assembly complex ATPase component TadA [Bacillota bacterium]
YYPDLTEAVFAELYGLSGIAPWAFDWTESYAKSSSAKLIGDRLYCLIDGKSCLQPQRITAKRRAQLIHALLLATPKERKETGFHEVYLHNGIRVTIYSGERSKNGQDVIVFRKYVMKQLSFEALAEKGTFPMEAVPLFRAMCRVGFNVVFAGQVRSGKTTFLQTWQASEDPSLEGVAVATDPETRWEAILPDAPLMQLIADGDDLLAIEKSLKRSDADYVILEEMRDAASYRLFLGITSLGTMRSKGTIHDGSALNIPYKMASAIASQLGGDRQAMIAQLFGSIHFVFELMQLPENKAQKRLKALWEYRYDPAEDRVCAQQLCSYDPKTDSWRWAPAIG